MQSGRGHSLPANICMGCLEHDFWIVWGWAW